MLRRLIILIMVVMSVFSANSLVYAEVTKSFDQMAGSFTIESKRTMTIKPEVEMHASLKKSFFSDDGFKDSRVTILSIYFTHEKYLPPRDMKKSFYWMVEGEQFGREEKWDKPVNEVGTWIVTPDFKKAMQSGKPIIFRVHFLLSIYEPQYFVLTPETLKEWNEVIAFNVQDELKEKVSSDRK